jgi:hypothetical protein
MHFWYHVFGGYSAPALLMSVVASSDIFPFRTVFSFGEYKNVKNAKSEKYSGKLMKACEFHYPKF